VQIGCLGGLVSASELPRARRATVAGGDIFLPEMAEWIGGAARAIELDSVSSAHAGAEIIASRIARTGSLDRKSSMNITEKLLTES
jgi:hypothetical protein